MKRKRRNGAGGQLATACSRYAQGKHLSRKHMRLLLRNYPEARYSANPRGNSARAIRERYIRQLGSEYFSLLGSFLRAEGAAPTGTLVYMVTGGSSSYISYNTFISTSGGLTFLPSPTTEDALLSIEAERLLNEGLTAVKTGKLKSFEPQGEKHGTLCRTSGSEQRRKNDLASY